jgi:hypothetical protein
MVRDDHLREWIALLASLVWVVAFGAALIIGGEASQRVRAEAELGACEERANRCDSEVNTCLYWQARVSYDLEALGERVR